MLHRFPTQLGRLALGATFILTMGLAESLYGDITGQSVISGSAEFIATSSGWVIKPSNGAIKFQVVFVSLTPSGQHVLSDRKIRRKCAGIRWISRSSQWS